GGQGIINNIMALQIKAKHKVCNINMLRGFVANYNRFCAKDGLARASGSMVGRPQALCSLAHWLGGCGERLQSVDLGSVERTACGAAASPLLALGEMALGRVRHAAIIEEISDDERRLHAEE
ncbi:MAG: hypothetical protein PHI71_11480, partial [Acidiphilium sp.]|nr:hypothetical protein [Acidiphilium sp.]